jgi:KDO2-lipid IV(A) lauroyltransferase
VFVALGILAMPLRWVPFAVQRGFAALLGDIVFYVVRFRRSIVLENLATAFPDRDATWIRRTARANYRHYVLVLLETLSSFGRTKERFLRSHRFVGKEKLDAVLAQGRGAVLLTSHLGNWELAIQAIASTGVPSSVVVKHSRYRQVDALLKRYREQTGARVLWEKHSGVEIFRSLLRGRVVGFVLDQFMGPPHGVPARFFGRMAGTAPSLALFVEKADFPVIPVFSFRDERGQATTVFEDVVDFGPLPTDPEARVIARTQRFNDILESQVRRHPEQWLWLHRRWKPFHSESRWASSLAQAAASTLGATLCLIAWAEGPIQFPPEPAVRAPIIETLGAGKGEGLEVEFVPATSGGPKGKDKFVAKNVDRIPFEVGERLEIDLTWMNLSAGTLTTEVFAGPIIDGRPTFHFWGNARSSRLVDAIYRVDNTVESFADAVALVPYRFLLMQDEAPQTKYSRAIFDYSRGMVSYWSQRKSKKWGDQTIEREDRFTTLARDMFTAFFAARAVDPKPGQKIRFPIYENGKNLDAEFTVLGHETLKTRAGLFPCWKLSLQLQLDNVLMQTGEVLLWLSDDPKHFPVKFQAKIKIGALAGTLVSVRDRSERNMAGQK